MTPKWGTPVHHEQKSVKSQPGSGKGAPQSFVTLLSWAVQIVELLGEDMVIYRKDNGVGSVFSKVIGVNNPGTPESALIDMRLLSECNEVVITVGSSYGSVAAAWGGIPPVHMLHGLHKNVQVRERPLISPPFQLCMNEG